MNKKLLRKKLALMLANLKKKRKYYCEVEYLESTGTQYIDTGIILKNTVKLSVVWSKPETTTYNFLLGSRTNTTGTDRFALLCNGNGFGYDFSSSDSGRGTFSFTTNTVYTTDVYFEDGSLKYVKNNGVNAGTIVSTVRTNCPYSLYLFDVNTAGSGTNYKGKFKIYRMSIDGVCDLIPVLDWNYVPCMYDRVSEQLFYNAGTGVFTAGREIHPVDYLESTGTQYIDTGINANSNPKYELKFVISYTNPLSPSPQYTGADSGGTYGVVNGNWLWSNNVPVTANQFYEIDYINQNGSRGAYVNGTDYYQGNHYASVGYRCLLFTAGRNSSGTTKTNLFSAKMKSCSIILGDALVRDFIPVIAPNNRPAMFDRVSQKLYYNQGSGEFLYGN